MVDIIINYETLFDVLRKEKSRDELQQLPHDFYGQVVAYLRVKRTEVDNAGGFLAPAAQKALVQYRNAQKILRELYERRERKVLEMSLNRARAQASLIDTTALLAEETPIYEELAKSLKSFRASMIELVMNGEAPAGLVVPELREPVPDNAVLEQPATRSAASPEEVERRETCSVRFVKPVPKFLGLKGETHGPFEPGDLAQLPGKIAAVLLRKNRVELA